jgi:hypothetical protein
MRIVGCFERAEDGGRRAEIIKGGKIEVFWEVSYGAESAAEAAV